MDNVQTLLVIFGITGDLAQRKLLPALRTIIHADALPNAQILGVSRREATPAEVLANLASDNPAADKALEQALTMFSMDVANPDDYRKLRQEIESLTKRMGEHAQVVFYLSVPPQASLPIVESLGAAGLNGPNVKLLLEKPFGVDLASAQESIERISRHFDESQLYRIDHYLAKEMTQNILAFRGQNAIFRNLWHKEFIEKIEIIATETIGIEGRAQFYEQTGALRDFMQNHMMQLLSLVLMKLPPTESVDDIPARRAQALQAIEPIQSNSFAAQVVRGQYEGYRDEVQIPESLTETFMSLRLFSNDPNWEGVPIHLATGKNLSAKTTEIRVYFKQIHAHESNLLVLHIQPKEAVEVDLVAKKPGYDKTYEPVKLSFAYDRALHASMDAYERVLVDAILSDKSLFTTADEILRSWEILQPIQERWAFHTDDLRHYKPGSTIEQIMA